MSAIRPSFAEAMIDFADSLHDRRVANAAELEALMEADMAREGELRGEALAVPPALSDRLMDYGILPEESK
jgi:hypothetical protein